MPEYVAAIDQGTTSTRFIVFDRDGHAVASAQREHEQIYPRPGWVEHDAEEIWRRTRELIGEARVSPADIVAAGITNQRETTVVWDRKTGAPIANAIVWQDTRVAEDVARLAAVHGQEYFRKKTGLPLATYFSALKVRWL
ncbi:MAG TPA: FGGY family carbohydrate kinase, partial [Bryobacteraceae bacterium]|nr:FGGY family carbohydrate kinase [Bryobacteraceae bacterium]